MKDRKEVEHENDCLVGEDVYVLLWSKQETTAVIEKKLWIVYRVSDQEKAYNKSF